MVSLPPLSGTRLTAKCARGRSFSLPCPVRTTRRSSPAGYVRELDSEVWRAFIFMKIMLCTEDYYFPDLNVTSSFMRSPVLVFIRFLEVRRFVVSIILPVAFAAPQQAHVYLRWPDEATADVCGTGRHRVTDPSCEEPCAGG